MLVDVLLGKIKAKWKAMRWASETKVPLILAKGLYLSHWVQGKVNHIVVSITFPC